MAKYDDFGRPIYETAEEYNRAHRAENNTHIYDSPESDAHKHQTIKNTYRNPHGAEQYTKQKRLKKSTVLIIGVAICFIAMVLFLMFNMVRGSTGVREPENNWVNIEEEVVDVEEEYLGDDTTPLPEGFETFSYNGQIYSLPATFTEINQMGFSLEEAYNENYMLPSEYEETLVLNDKDGYMAAMICVSNHTSEAISLDKSQVHYFYIENPMAFDETEEVPDFMFGDGLTLESSYEEVEAYFGIPYYHYEDHSEENCFYDSYQWEYYSEEETHFVSITFWNGVISDVGIEKRVTD